MIVINWFLWTDSFVLIYWFEFRHQTKNSCGIQTKQQKSALFLNKNKVWWGSVNLIRSISENAKQNGVKQPLNEMSTTQGLNPTPLKQQVSRIIPTESQGLVLCKSYIWYLSMITPSLRLHLSDTNSWCFRWSGLAPIHAEEWDSLFSCMDPNFKLYSIVTSKFALTVFK